MPKALIAYLSQGGSTKKIADQVAIGLSDDGFMVDTYDVSAGLQTDLRSFDLLGIGTPTYVFRPPFNVMDFLRSLPPLSGKPFFVFLLYGTIPGTAGNIVRRKLARKGGREVGYRKFKGPDYFIGYLQRGVLFSPDNPTNEELQVAREFGRSVATFASGGGYAKPPRDSPPTVVHTFERIVTMRFLLSQFYSRFFKANQERCSSCGICVENCPQGNISLDDNGKPIWGRDCMGCFYCELRCPEDAITSPMDWPLFEPFMAYNIWHSKRDPSLEHSEVSLHGGRVDKTAP